MSYGAKNRLARGFTLIEVLAAALLLSGTILGFIRIMADNLSISRETQLRFTSMLLAEGEVERIKSVWYKDFTTDVTASNQDLGDGYLANYTPTLSTYLNSVHVQVGYDSDSNGSLDSDEVLVSLDTQYADH